MHEHAPLPKPGGCRGRRICCKPNIPALLSTSMNIDDDCKSLQNCALLDTSTIVLMIVEVLVPVCIPVLITIVALGRAVIIEIFIIRLNTNVTMMVIMVRTIWTWKRTIMLLIVTVPTTVIETVVVSLTMIITVVLIGLVNAILLKSNTIPKRMIGVIVVLVITTAIVVLIPAGICSNKLNIGTNQIATIGVVVLRLSLLLIRIFVIMEVVMVMMIGLVRLV